jgi:outer membrane protein assembly factor BamA
VGLSTQKNIGLDKENLTTSFSYNWTPNNTNTTRFDLFNIQYIRNLNTQNYFNIYSTSYDALNNYGKTYNTDVSNVNENGDLIIEKGTSAFTQEVLSGNTALAPGSKDFLAINSIEERRIRLTENDFILATNFTFSNTTKTDLQDNNFFLFKTKIESAGTLLSVFANAANLPKNQNGNYKIFNLEYSEYIKTEFDYIKHWELSKENIIAVRSFFGIAIPYGNSKNIPFSRSYFSGGPNDNRGWLPYSLGPGSSGALNDFNEANMKIATSAELRYKILGSLKGALFVDAGNIWNVLDNVIDEKSTFKKISDLKKIAVGSGFGLRYDLSFFIIRLDLGFKTYNPAKEIGKQWFREFNLAQSVLNFGINYPF